MRDVARGRRRCVDHQHPSPGPRRGGHGQSPGCGAHAVARTRGHKHHAAAPSLGPLGGRRVSVVAQQPGEQRVVGEPQTDWRALAGCCARSRHGGQHRQIQRDPDLSRRAQGVVEELRGVGHHARAEKAQHQAQQQVEHHSRSHPPKRAGRGLDHRDVREALGLQRLIDVGLLEVLGAAAILTAQHLNVPLQAHQAKLEVVERANLGIDLPELRLQRLGTRPSGPGVDAAFEARSLEILVLSAQRGLGVGAGPLVGVEQTLGRLDLPLHVDHRPMLIGVLDPQPLGLEPELVEPKPHAVDRGVGHAASGLGHDGLGRYAELPPNLGQSGLRCGPLRLSASQGLFELGATPNEGAPLLVDVADPHGVTQIAQRGLPFVERGIGLGEPGGEKRRGVTAQMHGDVLAHEAIDHRVDHPLADLRAVALERHMQNVALARNLDADPPADLEDRPIAPALPTGRLGPRISRPGAQPGRNTDRERPLKLGAGGLGENLLGPHAIDHELRQATAAQNRESRVDLPRPILLDGQRLAVAGRADQGHALPADADHQASLGAIDLRGVKSQGGHERRHQNQDRQDLPRVSK